jgi:hypothetical protein
MGKSGVWGLCWVGFVELVVLAFVQLLLPLLMNNLGVVLRRWSVESLDG